MEIVVWTIERDKRVRFSREQFDGAVECELTYLDKNESETFTITPDSWRRITRLMGV